MTSNTRAADSSGRRSLDILRPDDVHWQDAEQHNIRINHSAPHPPSPNYPLHLLTFPSEAPAMKPFSIASLLALAASISAKPMSLEKCSDPPTTTIAGVTVIDTPIVRDARKLISNATSYAYKHQMRSWLFGAAAMNANATLREGIDLEVHALGTMLHDLGWDRSRASKDRRFEVDGAIGAAEFIESHPDAPNWSERRIEGVWDAIALQGEPNIGDFKRDKNIGYIGSSIGVDYMGRAYLPSVPQADYDNIIAMFPDDDLLSGTNETFLWFCRTKPQTTYSNWVQPWGDMWVEGYSAVGHRSIDLFIPRN
ncbi:hypothetical protein F4780DRAFT_727552 [Xylariomycetidae sp. FL0641]|nr:hypothetical protein F4780DRAFT_727552 [Xylariomycetidae sp. FL0641]